jgi:hypothetical protein
MKKAFKIIVYSLLSLQLILPIYYFIDFLLNINRSDALLTTQTEYLLQVYLIGPKGVFLNISPIISAVLILIAINGSVFVIFLIIEIKRIFAKLIK